MVETILCKIHSISDKRSCTMMTIMDSKQLASGFHVSGSTQLLFRILQGPPNHLVQSASFFVPQTCILSSITAKNQIHWSKVQSFTISGSPATRVPASQQWIVQWVEIFSSRCARSVNFFVIAFLFVKSLVKNFPRCARPFPFVKSFCNCF